MFRLTKYLFLVGLPLTIVIIVLLTWMFRIVAFNDIQKVSEKSNIILSRAMANVLWPQIHGLVASLNAESTPEHTPIDLQNNMVMDMIALMMDEPLAELVTGTNVLKVKLFDLDGLTLFSTESHQAGVRHDENYGGIANARRGEVTAHIRFHKQFPSFSGVTLRNRYVLSSYMPLRNTSNQNIEAVIEIYTDITDVYDQIHVSQYKFALVLSCVFVVMGFVLFFTLRYLERTIQNNIELVVARDSEKDANKAKSRFLANMSHELRTPLNAIIGYSELLAEDCDTEGNHAAAKDLSKIRTAARHLLNLISEILDLSKIEAGQMGLFVENVSIGKLLDEVVSVLNPLIVERNNILKMECGNPREKIKTDVVKLRQILFNLLSNASKFTENGTIIISIESQHGWLTINISDTGIGMSQGQMNNLFKPFVQADGSTTRKYGGTGLGLAISKQFCEMMGGTIAVSSTVGTGTTFTVRIPAAIETENAAEELTESAA
ncbi:MAG: HAMP domain-containing histidine kinase [Gammaproteobacteria bacterium]|jgi:signal transduction histidine kinase|nr:HAMP domain-containing histidine kinase [Gammaproteobacteria bacterium]